MVGIFGHSDGRAHEPIGNLVIIVWSIPLLFVLARPESGIQASRPSCERASREHAHLFSDSAFAFSNPKIISSLEILKLTSFSSCYSLDICRRDRPD